jgi:hypothetical protein
MKNGNSSFIFRIIPTIEKLGTIHSWWPMQHFLPLARGFMGNRDTDAKVLTAHSTHFSQTHASFSLIFQVFCHFVRENSPAISNPSAMKTAYAFFLLALAASSGEPLLPRRRNQPRFISACLVYTVADEAKLLSALRRAFPNKNDLGHGSVPMQHEHSAPSPLLRCSFQPWESLASSSRTP